MIYLYEMFIETNRSVDMEKRDLYNENRKLINKTIYKEEAIPEGYYILVVIAVILNKGNKYLIQKTSKIKGGEWALTGGHPKTGENSLEGIKSEIREELGITAINPILFEQVKDKQVFGDLYYLKQDININDIIMQEEEVSDVKFVTKEEIDELYNNGLFKKGHYKVFKDYLNYINK